MRFLVLSGEDIAFAARQVPPALRGAFVFAPEPGAEYDATFVIHRPPAPDPRLTHRTRTLVLLCAEPPAFLQYHKSYVDQFDAVLTTDPRLASVAGPGTRVLASPPCIPWFYGAAVGGVAGGPRPAQTFEDLADAPVPDKTRTVSVVSSTKTDTPGHRARLAFALGLRRELGPDLAVFGRGLIDFRDKQEVIAPFRYHVAIENSCLDDYWTEKLADCYLGYTFPFYAGAPNLDRYFPRESFEPLDATDPKGSAEKIRGMIAAGTWEKRLPALREARSALLYRHNLFPHLVEQYRRLTDGRTPSPARSRTVPTGPITRPSLVRSVIDRVRTRLARGRTAAVVGELSALSREQAPRPVDRAGKVSA